MSIEIKRACQSDAGIIAKIICESWKEAYKNIISKEFITQKTNIDERTKLFEKILSENKQIIYLVFDNDKPCGVCTCDVSKDADLTDTFEIIAIYFLPEYWNKGYGTKTMTYVIRQIKDKGYNRISLWTLENNEQAKHFYEKCGFVSDIIRKCDFDNSLNYERFIYNLKNKR